MAVLAGLLVLLFWRFSQSPDWKQFSWRQVWLLLVHASPEWLGAAVVATYSSYLIRAYRWKFFLDPLKPASLQVLFTGQIFGFSAVYLIGRPGELVRPAYIARWENVPFVSQLAILVLERMYDVIALALFFALALYEEPMPSGGRQAARTLHRMHEGSMIVLLAMAGLVAALVIYRFRSEPIVHWAGARLRFLPFKVHRALGNMARSFAEGLDVIQNWKDLAASVICTAVLWVVNIGVYFFVFRSLGGVLARLSWWTTIVVAFSASFGLVVQLPGIGGGFQFAILGVLKQLFHVPPTQATSAALLQWIVLFVPCVALAVALLVYGGLSFRSLRAMAEAEHAAIPNKGARQGPI